MEWKPGNDHHFAKLIQSILVGLVQWNENEDWSNRAQRYWMIFGRLGSMDWKSDNDHQIHKLIQSMSVGLLQSIESINRSN
jgi:hypothetical protein